jgi:DNA-binding CsgD family transcriptional regulator
VSAEPVGRGAGLAAVRELLDAVPGGSASLLFRGAAGVGKTTLWRFGTEEAERRGMAVLSARAAEPEAESSFATVADLLDLALDDVLPRLPGPQAEALEVALLRRAPRGPTTDRAVGAALLTAIRELARMGPAVVAIDDVQWVDSASASVLSFAFRRLGRERVGVLVTERLPHGGVRSPAGSDHGRVRSIADSLAAGERFRRVEVEGLSAAALHSVLAASFGRDITWPLLLRIHRATGGNPLFALELARAIGGRIVGPNDPLPAPADLQELVLGRICELAPEVRDVLVMAAALPSPSPAVLELAGGDDVGASLEAAQGAGVIRITGEAIAFDHPLFATVVYAASAPRRRRAVHARLARVLTDPEERARHLALATAGPDEAVAGTLEEAARTARARGGRATAGELFQMAAALTPENALGAWGRRTISAALCHHESGSGEEARRLLRGAITALPAGPGRAEALWALAYTETEWERNGDLCLQAAREAGDDARLLARIQLVLAEWRWMESGIRSAIQEADRGVDLAEESGDAALLTQTLALAGHAHVAAGLPGGERMLRRALTTVPLGADIPAWYRPAHWMGCALMWADRLEEARPLLVQEYERSEVTGNDVDRSGLAFHLCQLECRAGRLAAARTYGEVAYRLAAMHGGEEAQALALLTAALALVEAIEGRAEEARALSGRALNTARRLGDRLSAMHHRGILGFLELSIGNLSAAHAQLDGMAGELEDLGIGEPGLYPFVPEEIEALLGLGLFDRADALTEGLERRGGELGRPRLLATGARCRAYLLAATGDPADALASLEAALRHHARFAVPLELGRTLLAKGQVLRRLKQKRAARETFQEAVQIFERLGAPLWAGRARAELARIGLRPPAPLGLTPTEERVAELVAAGYTNREVAQALFVSVHTVEDNLRRVFRKLGVRSRTELAANRPSRGSQRPQR